MKKGGGSMGRYEKKNKVVSTQERTEKKAVVSLIALANVQVLVLEL